MAGGPPALRQGRGSVHDLPVAAFVGADAEEASVFLEEGKVSLDAADGETDFSGQAGAGDFGIGPDGIEVFYHTFCHIFSHTGFHALQSVADGEGFFKKTRPGLGGAGCLGWTVAQPRPIMLKTRTKRATVSTTPRVIR